MSTRASEDRYARALLDVVAHQGDPERVQQELDGFAEVFRSSELAEVSSSPAVPVTSKRAIVEALVGKTAPSAPVRNLLLILADRNRLALVPGIATAYTERLLEFRQIVRVELTTAVPLSAERAQEFERRLTAATGRRVTMTTAVDSGLIGGAVARIGTMVYDGSVASQLARIRERLEQ